MKTEGRSSKVFTIQRSPFMARVDAFTDALRDDAYALQRRELAKGVTLFCPRDLIYEILGSGLDVKVVNFVVGHKAFPKITIRNRNVYELYAFGHHIDDNLLWPNVDRELSL